MRISALLTLALAPAALIAQAPAPLAFSQQWKAQGPILEKLLKDFQPQEALDQAEALLPSVEPVFDKKDVNTVRASSFQFSDLARIYHFAGKAAIAAGRWEKGRDYFIKAKEVAQRDLVQTTQELTAAMDVWKEPVETAKKALQEGAARLAELGGKQPLTPQEDTELRNFQVQQQNVLNGEKLIRVFRKDLAYLKTESDAFPPMVEGVDKSLEAEKTEMDQELASKKYKGGKPAYLAAILNGKNLEIRASKQDKLYFLHRLEILCAGTPQAEKVKAVIERVRLDQDPFPVGKSSKKKQNT